MSEGKKKLSEGKKKLSEGKKEVVRRKKKVVRRKKKNVRRKKKMSEGKKKVRRTKKMSEGMVLWHVATCSGPARAAERALPCGCRVKVVHASLHGSRIKASDNSAAQRCIHLLVCRGTHVDCDPRLVQPQRRMRQRIGMLREVFRDVVWHWFLARAYFIRAAGWYWFGL